MTIKIRTPEKTVAHVDDADDDVVNKITKRWTKILDSRAAWRGNESLRADLSSIAAKDLKRLGVDREELEGLATHYLAEVSFSASGGRSGWDLPWEHLITTAARFHSIEAQMLVVRHLSGYHQPNTSSSLKKGGMFVAAPGGTYDLCREEFEREERTLRLALTSGEGTKGALKVRKHSSTLSNLQRFVDNKTCGFDFLHLSGIGASTIEEQFGQIPDDSNLVFLDPKFPGTSKTGGDVRRAWRMGLKHQTRFEDYSPEDIAKAINSRSPSLVTSSLPNSGFELAPLLVAGGVDVAIGIHPLLDPMITHVMNYHFYRTLVQLKTSHTTALISAWKHIQPYRTTLRGSTICAWSVRSIKDGTLDDLEKLRLRGNDNTRGITVSKEDRTLGAKLRFEVRPQESVNYSMLHNDRSVFKQCKISFNGNQDSEKRTETAETHELQLEVKLDVGDRSFDYYTTFTIGDVNPVCDFTQSPYAVNLPLNSDEIRNIQEPIKANLYIAFRDMQSNVLFQRTFPVKISPMDAWRLDDNDIWWVSSFVQSRDPAVAQIIEKAQLRLQCLMDDEDAGFAGYQLEDIDSQVQAIWHTLLTDYHLKYVNPPPSFSDEAQRLRTPGDIVREGRGTCVDLALLFCSCLEWVEIYPVLFMLEGHAFPGYWQSTEAYDRFIAPDLSYKGFRDNQQMPWVYRGSHAYERICPIVPGELTPVETVGLTKGVSFTNSRDDQYDEDTGESANEEHGAVAYFRNRDYGAMYRFHSMIDIFSARKHGVTALPIADLK